jgi:hypothetical protein
VDAALKREEEREVCGGFGSPAADGLGSNGDRPGRERNMRWVRHGRDFRFPLFSFLGLH